MTVQTRTIRVPLSNDGRHAIDVQVQWVAAANGTMAVSLVDFASDWLIFSQHTAGYYDVLRSTWISADGFRIDRNTAEDRAMSLAFVLAQRAVDSEGDVA